MSVSEATSFGRHLKLHITGASHARNMTFRLTGFPAGFHLDRAALAALMERRAPGRDHLSTRRRETDQVFFRAGITHDVTTGGPIVGVLENTDARPRDYGAERTVPRPGHADFGQWVHAGRIPTGGGKNSGRLTAPLCAAGALCKQWLKLRGIDVVAEAVCIGGKTDEKGMAAAIEKACKAGDSVGGIVSCTIVCPPVGLGGPLQEGLESELSAALFAIPGVKGVTFGAAGDCVDVCGSEFNDPFVLRRGEVVTAGNRHGGILGGRTSGMPITFDVILRPTPTVFVEQNSIDLATMKPAKLAMKGRHDPCIVRRAVPVVEAVAAFVLADAILADEAAHPRICLTLTGQTLAEDLAHYQAQRYFTDLVELRVDLLKKSERARAARFPEMLRTSGHTPRPVPVILTFRKKCDGGAFVGAESERLAFFKRMLKRENGFFAVDFEEGLGDDALVAAARAAGVKIIRSLHAFDGPVTNISATLKRLASAGDFAKIAFQPQTLADVSRLFRARRASFGAFPFILCAMGPLGLASRVLAGRLGSAWTYASVGGLEGLGHLSPQTLVRDYRFRSVTRAATLFGVTGWPLQTTRSPELHNAAFLAEDEDALMIPFPAKTANEARAFMKAMKMRALAVTIPHKRAILPLLDRVDPAAQKVGAVNTVVMKGEKLVGFNTDVQGFAEALIAFAGSVRGKTAAVLGDGGAAQAVKVALNALGVTFKVFHRVTPPQGFDILINATPVDPIPDYVFTGKELVYDLRYVPEVTPLLKRAQDAGCRTENGFSMLVAQAREQQRLFRS